jgi:hypothetical protein
MKAQEASLVMHVSYQNVNIYLSQNILIFFLKTKPLTPILVSCKMSSPYPLFVSLSLLMTTKSWTKWTPLPFLCVLFYFIDHQELNKMSSPYPFLVFFSFLLTTKSWTKWASLTFSSIFHHFLGVVAHKTKKQKTYCISCLFPTTFFHPLCWSCLVLEMEGSSTWFIDNEKQKKINNNKILKW